MRRDHVHTRIHENSPQEAIYNSIASYTIDGRPYDKLEPQFLDDPQFDPRYTEAFSNLNIALFTFAAVGIDGVAIQTLYRSSDRGDPDFEVTLPGGDRVFLEVTPVISTASSKYNNFIAQLNADVARALLDPHLQERLRGAAASIIIPRVPATSPSDLLAEVIRFLRAETLTTEEATIESIGPSYPILNSISAQVIRTRQVGETWHFAIREPARSVGPYDLVGLTLRKLEQKRRQAVATKLKPLWLSLYFAETMAVGETNLRLLANNPPDSIAPFERVFAGDQQKMIEYYVEQSP